MAGKIITQLIIDGKNKAGAAFKEADSQLSKIGASAKKAGAYILGALSITALSAWVKGSIAASDAAIKTARSVGVTVEELTALRYAAELGGVSSAELTAGLSKLNRTIDEAANGGATQAEAFDRLGVSVLDAAGNVKDSGTVLAEMADRFQVMPDGVQKSALAMELFSRSGAKLVSMLNGGSDGLVALRKEAEALGRVISTETAIQAELFDDNLSRLGSTAAGAGNKISSEMLPTLLDLTDLLVEVNKGGEAATIIANLLGGTLKILATIVLVLGEAFGEVGRLIGATAAAAVAVARGDFSRAGEIMREVTRDNTKSTNAMVNRIGLMWSGAGKAAVAAGIEQKKQQKLMTGNLERTTDDMAVELKRQVKDAQESVKARVAAEKEAAKELEKAKDAQLDTQKRYSDALAALNAGGGDPTFSAAMDLKYAANQALAAGDTEGAKKNAQAALEVLTDLAAAGENTYGFAGFIQQLQGIEESADQINVDQAQASFDAAAAEALKLKTILDDLKEVKIDITMSPEAIAAVKAQMQALADELGQQMIITPTVVMPPIPVVVAKDQGGSALLGRDPDVPYANRFATGGRVRGPGSGTSDSIMARLSNGEYVLKAAAVRQYGTSLLDRMNGLRMPKYASGGLVESTASLPGATPGRDLGRVDLTVGGESFSLLAGGDQFERLLRRTASKFGRTHT